MFGRIGRVGFILGYVLIAAIGFQFEAVVGSLLSKFPPATARAGLAAVLFFIACWLTTLRCHDYGETFWSNFWTEQTPFIGQAWALAELCFKAGDSGPNMYGDPPLI